jgi:transcriptional regulator with XRE-family HTH domain
MLHICEYLRNCRLAKGLTLETVAKRAGTTKSQIDKLEKGERRLTVEWFVRICDALEVSPKRFFD